MDSTTTLDRKFGLIKSVAECGIAGPIDHRCAGIRAPRGRHPSRLSSDAPRPVPIASAINNMENVLTLYFSLGFVSRIKWR